MFYEGCVFKMLNRQKIYSHFFYPLLTVLAILGYLALLFCFLIFPQKNTTQSNTPLQNTSAYLQTWNIYSESFKENYYASSDHSAFGEGFQYSVLSGSITLNSSSNKRGDCLTKTTGNGSDLNVTWFLNDVWDALDVPTENRCPIAHCNWVIFSTDGGDRLLIATSKDDNTIYVAEQIL